MQAQSHIAKAMWLLCFQEDMLRAATKNCFLQNLLKNSSAQPFNFYAQLPSER